MQNTLVNSLILSLPTIVSITCSLSILINYKKNYNFQNVLGISILLCGIEYYILANYFYGVKDYVLYSRLDLLDCFTTLMIYPTMYFYFKLLTESTPIKWYNTLIFLPSLVVIIGAIISYLQIGETEIALLNEKLITAKQRFADQEIAAKYNNYFYFSVTAYNFLIIIQPIFVGIYSIVSIYKYHKRLTNFFSSTEEKSIEINTSVVIWFLIQITFAFLFVLLSRHTISESTQLIYLLSIIGSIVTFCLTHQSSKIKYSAETFEEEIAIADQNIEQYIQNTEVQKNETETEKTKKIRYQRLLQEFNKVMDEDQIFLQKNIRIDDVAKAISTNRTYISRIINQEYQCSYSEFINRKRIDYAKNLIKTVHKIKQEELAELAGFPHASSFNRNFKLYTGTTPKKWQNDNNNPK